MWDFCILQLVVQQNMTENKTEQKTYSDDAKHTRIDNESSKHILTPISLLLKLSPIIPYSMEDSCRKTMYTAWYGF